MTTCTVHHANQAPTVNAGADDTIDSPNSASLSGTATDDRYPSGSTVSVSWSKNSGDVNVTFSNPNSLTTTAAFSSSGVYVLRLTATDGELSSYDDVAITVRLENQAPIVSAGNDQQSSCLSAPVLMELRPTTVILLAAPSPSLGARRQATDKLPFRIRAI